MAPNRQNPTLQAQDRPAQAHLESSAVAATLSWRAHPAAQRPRSAALGAALVALTVAMVYISFQSIWWALLGLGILVLALNRFFLPSTFSVDEEGITARYPLRTVRLDWADLRRFVHDRYGGYLSTRSKASRLDAYRGMHLLFGPPGSREAAIEEIQRRMKQRSAPASATLQAASESVSHGGRL